MSDADSRQFEKPHQIARISPTHSWRCNFDSLIRNGQVDKAFDAWAREANRILLHVAKSQGFQNDTQRAQRGKIVFHAQRRHPPAIGAQASTLQTRRLWKAYNRATEVSMAVDGTRRQRTWEAIRTVLPYLNPVSWQQIEPILNQPASHDSASKVAQLIDQMLENENRANHFDKN